MATLAHVRVEQHRLRDPRHKPAVQRQPSAFCSPTSGRPVLPSWGHRDFDSSTRVGPMVRGPPFRCTPMSFETSPARHATCRSSWCVPDLNPYIRCAGGLVCVFITRTNAVLFLIRRHSSRYHVRRFVAKLLRCRLRRKSRTRNLVAPALSARP